MTIAIIDCNSFYCSCERVFNPKLRKQPLIVLSNNDGVTISRTDEAKSVGIKMGDPLFKIKDLIRKHGVHVYSSNYSLYGDMSARVMSTLTALAPAIEVYSIDEAFLDINGISDPLNWGFNVCKTVLQNTGIPTSIGIGPTKVLAKLANKAAKKAKTTAIDVSNETIRHQLMRNFPIGDIWGIGHQSTKKLNQIGIHTAYELMTADLDHMQNLLTIVGRRIILELRGIPQIQLELDKPDKKSIVCSRSFGSEVTTLDDLKPALANFVTRGAEKIRRQNSVCANLQVFIHSNRFKAENQYYQSISTGLEWATDSTPDLIAAAFRCLEKIYKPGVLYKKAGVMFTDLRPKNSQAIGLFQDKLQLEKNETLMSLMDELNKKFGKGTLKSAACLDPSGKNMHTKSNWHMTSQFRSPRYTTKWDEILGVFENNAFNKESL